MFSNPQSRTGVLPVTKGIMHITIFLSVIEPNMDSYVFVRANEDVDGVLVEEETTEQV